MITVFTPTYNRVHLLDRLYHSLIFQTCKDFEWLVIDDGSTDETQQYMERVQKENAIKIRYYRQENGGKHVAHNTAVSLAEGDWFYCVDSDDWLADDAIFRISSALREVAQSDCAVIGYKTLGDGKMLCKPFSPQMNHKGFYEMISMGAGGEYSIILKANLIRKYLFPVVPNEKFSTEAILYDRLELDGYTMCPIPRVMTICEYQEDGLTSQIYQSLLKNPTAYQLFHKQRIDLVNTWKERGRHCVQYQAFRRLSRNKEYIYEGKYKWLVMLAYIPGLVGAQYYKLRRKK